MTKINEGVTQEELDRIPNYQPEFGENTLATTDSDFYEAGYRNLVKSLVDENPEINKEERYALGDLPLNNGLEKAYIRELLSLDEMIEIVSKDPNNEHYKKALDCILDFGFVYKNPNHKIIPVLIKHIDQTYSESFDALSYFITKNPHTKHLNMVLDLMMEYGVDWLVSFFLKYAEKNRYVCFELLIKFEKKDKTEHNELILKLIEDYKVPAIKKSYDSGAILDLIKTMYPTYFTYIVIN